MSVQKDCQYFELSVRKFQERQYLIDSVFYICQRFSIYYSQKRKTQRSLLSMQENKTTQKKPHLSSELDTSDVLANNLSKINYDRDTIIFKIKTPPQISQKIKKITWIANELQFTGKIFQSFKNRGKYKFLKYSYESESPHQGTLILEIYGSYFNEMVKNRLINQTDLIEKIKKKWEEYVDLVEFILKNSILASDFELISIDAIAITIAKEYFLINEYNKSIIRKYYIRDSFFQFRSNLPTSSGTQEEFFSCIIYEDMNPLDPYRRIPKDFEYQTAPRHYFFDDLYLIGVRLSRFCQRFVPFHQIFTLYNSKSEIQANKYIREFYRKCFNQSKFYSMRLKKATFTFKIKRLILQNENNYQEQTSLLSLVLNFQESNQQNQSFPKAIYCFLVESFYPGISTQILNEIFSRRMHAMSQEKSNLLKNQILIQGHQVFIAPKNQVVYSRILTEFSYFIDRIFFKLMEVQDKKASKNISQPQLVPYSITETIMKIKLPLSQEFDIRSSKFYHMYSIQLKSSYVQPKKDDAAQKLFLKDFYFYQTTVSEIKIIRKKKKPANQIEKEHQLFSKNMFNFKGMKLYINSLLNAWNIREIYDEVTEFSSAYLNIIIQKSKEKVGQRSFGKWPSIIEGIQALIQSLTEGFNTVSTTIKLHILSGYEEEKDLQTSNSSQISEEQCLMSMTISLFQLTGTGWKQCIPSCAFFFQVYSSVILMLNRKGQKLTELLITHPKKKMQTLFKEQFRKICGTRVFIPRNFYENKQLFV